MRLSRLSSLRLLAGLMTAALSVGSMAVPTVAARNGHAPPGGPSCNLGNGIQHVIYVQFDNTHLTRDANGVYSDLEQMPHLLNFLKDNGTVLQKQYTILISHTAGGILSSLTGLYPDRNGITVSNSYDYYQPNGVPTYTSAFKYWTSKVSATDSSYNMVTTGGKNTPAPWVSYTRAGCDVGNVSVANTVLENATAGSFVAGPTDLYYAAHAGDTSIDLYSSYGFHAGDTITIDQGANQETATIDHFSGYYTYLTAPLAHDHAAGTSVWEGPVTPNPAGDLTTTYGAGSPEWQEGLNSQEAPYGSAAANLATTDFVGIAVHCAKTDSSVCHDNSNARPDPLPDEPGGYTGYQALFGAKYVDPAINGGSASVDDTSGNPITDSFGQPGFPGFDSMSAANTLGYVAQMQEAGVPITYAYISDAHDNHSGAGAYGPGEAGYVAELHAYDNAFGAFFDRLAADGINKSNTLFVFTADENDHYTGQQPNAAPFNEGCDGVTVLCTYNTPGGIPQHGQYDVSNGGQSVSSWTGPSTWPPSGTNGPLVGEVGYNMSWLLGYTIAGKGYDISFDSAPSFYIDDQPQAVNGSGGAVVNSTLRAFENAATGLNAFDPYLDPTQLTPVGRYFVDGPTLAALHMVNADPKRTMSFTMFSQPDYYFQTYSPCHYPSQGCVNDSYAWIHGDYTNDIGQTWLGMVGPGIRSNGIDDTTWTDHTDIVPTMDAVLGLTRDYQTDGRVISQILTPSANGGRNGASFRRLGDVYKQLNAPYGDFAHSLIVASTQGIRADDATYLWTEQQIVQLTQRRDVLAQKMKDVLDGTARGHRNQLVHKAQVLMAQAASLAGL